MMEFILNVIGATALFLFLLWVIPGSEGTMRKQHPNWFKDKDD